MGYTMASLWSKKVKFGDIGNGGGASGEGHPQFWLITQRKHVKKRIEMWINKILVYKEMIPILKKKMRIIEFLKCLYIYCF